MVSQSTADAANTGTAYASVQGVTDTSQLTSDRLAGTQYEIAFSSGAGGTLDYTVTSGIGVPGTARLFGDQHHGGVGQLHTRCRPAVRRFRHQRRRDAGGGRRILRSAGRYIESLPNRSRVDFRASIQHHRILSKSRMRSPISTARKPTFCPAEATLGSSLSEIQGVQTTLDTQSTSDQVQLTSLQSANLPQVLANYSESVTALQAAEFAFAKIQNLSLVFGDSVIPDKKRPLPAVSVDRSIRLVSVVSGEPHPSISGPDGGKLGRDRCACRRTQ